MPDSYREITNDLNLSYIAGEMATWQNHGRQTHRDSRVFMILPHHDSAPPQAAQAPPLRVAGLGVLESPEQMGSNEPLKLKALFPCFSGATDAQRLDSDSQIQRGKFNGRRNLHFWGINEVTTPFILFLASRGDVVSNGFNLWKQGGNLSYANVGSFDSFAQRAHVVTAYPAGTLRMERLNRSKRREQRNSKSSFPSFASVESRPWGLGQGWLAPGRIRRWIPSTSFIS